MQGLPLSRKMLVTRKRKPSALTCEIQGAQHTCRISMKKAKISLSPNSNSKTPQTSGYCGVTALDSALNHHAAKDDTRLQQGHYTWNKFPPWL